MPPRSSRRKQSERVKFVYGFSPYYRVVHSNGVWGGITPRQELSITFYSELSTRPNAVTHEVTPEGGLGREVSKEIGKTGELDNVHREYEVAVIMNMAEAKSVYDWLGEKIDAWNEQHPELQSESGKSNDGSGDLLNS